MISLTLDNLSLWNISVRLEPNTESKRQSLVCFQTLLHVATLSYHSRRKKESKKNVQPNEVITSQHVV